MVEVQLLKIFFEWFVFELLVIAVVSVFAVWLVQFHWNRRRLYEISKQVHGPKPIPIIGNALYFVGDILESLLYIQKKYESRCRIWMGHKLYYVLGDPEDVKIVLNNPNTLAKDDFYRFAIPLFANGLITSPVPKWRRHRKVIAPTFNQKILDDFVKIFIEHSKNLIEKQLNECVGKGIIDVLHMISCSTVDMICESAMGTRVNAQTTYTQIGNWIGRAAEIFILRCFRIWYHIDFIYKLSPMSREEKQLTTNIHDVAFKVVKEKRLAYQKLCDERKYKPEAQIDEGTQKQKAFLDLLMELSEDGMKFTDTEIKDEVITFMVAGSDATAVISSSVLVMLGIHQDVQQKVYEEILEVVGTERDIEPADLPRLIYLERVIKETMRLFPITAIISRKVENDVALSTCTLPKDSLVIVGNFYIQRNEKYWPEPLKFNPDRFLPEEVAKRHPYTYLPFSGGPRNCIGIKYAMMVMKTLIFTIIRKYKVSSDYKNVSEIKLILKMALKMKNGYNVAFDLREKPL